MKMVPLCQANGHSIHPASLRFWSNRSSRDRKKVSEVNLKELLEMKGRSGLGMPFFQGRLHICQNKKAPLKEF
jgi:hypothetical protein